MAYRPWTRLIPFALLALASCGGGSSGTSGGDGGAGGEAGAGGLTLSIDDAQVAEGDVSKAELRFTITLSEPSSEIVKVAYATEDDTAKAGGLPVPGGFDYDEASATLRFDPGETKQTVTVTVNGDRISEPDETLKVVLSKPVGATIADDTGVGTIENDDAPPPVISISKTAELDEGNSGNANASLTVSLSKASALPITVEYKSADGTATAGQDYEAVSGTLTFPPGQTTKQVAVPVVGDTSQEPDETLTISLSKPTNATLGNAVATLTIVNDDAGSATLSISDAEVSEGSAGKKTLSFTIDLSAASADTVTVDYATIDGTATAGGLAAAGGVDYVPASDGVTFAPGETSKQIDISVNGDTLNEADETLTVELFNGVNALVVDPQGVGTISNDDALPSITIGDVSLNEGAAGARTASFMVSLSNGSGRSVSVSYNTSNGTASAGSDYVASSGKLTFDPGQTSALVSVTVNGDLLNEDDETFLVNLLSAANGAIDDSQALGTIYNDDPLPELAIGNVVVVEGDAGTKNAVFSVDLSAPSGQTVSVAWTSADDTATAGVDYVAASGSLTFAPGVTTRTLNVAVNGDQLDEPNETFFVNLSNPSHASISGAQGIGTIITDDSSLPGLNIDDVSVVEGDAGTAKLTLTVTLDKASAQQVKVNYATSSDTASSGTDFQATSGTLTFNAGETFKTIDVFVNGDTLHEPDELLLVTLSTPVNAFVADGQGQGTISNDDAAPSLSIDDVSLAEGNAGTKLLTFTVSLSAPSSFQVSVSYATADGTAVESGASSAGQADYLATSDVLVFAPGETSANISVPINGDVVTEVTETFFVQLSAPQNASLADGQGQGTITNDDAVPTLSINDVSATEGNAGTKTFTFSVTLSATSGSQVSVDFTTADGTALNPSDYLLASGTLVLDPGQTTGTIDVTVNGDKLVEGHKDETFTLKLSNPVGATLSDAQGLGTILDDD
jgi:hypothetical protein